MEEFKYVGEWWLRGDSACRCAGTLEYTDADGLRLRLVGTTGEILQSQRGVTHDVILGLAEEVGEVTLWRSNCVKPDKRDNSDQRSPVDVQFQPVAAYFGTHLTDFMKTREPAFSGISVEFAEIQEWLSQSGFGVPQRNSADSSIEFKKPDVIQAELAQCTTTIYFGFTADYGQFAQSIEQKVIVEYESDAQLSLSSWLSEVVVPFQEFLSVAAGVPCQLVSTEVRIPDYDKHSASRERYTTVVFQPWRRIAVPPNLKRVPRGFGLIPWWKALPRWQELLTSWLAVRKELDSVVDLYLTSKFHHRSFPFAEAEFLNAAQAIESYHGRRSYTKVMDDRTKNTVISAAKEAVPKEFRHRVAQQLTRIHEKTFQERLLEIFEEQAALLNELVDDTDQFAKRVKDTRNYMVHLDPKGESKRLQGIDLIDAIDVLWVVVERLLLTELGFDHADATQMVMNTKRYMEIGNRREVPYF